MMPETPNDPEYLRKKRLRELADPAPASPTLPSFTYFSDDALAKVCKPSDEVCDCCETRQGFIYSGSFYHPGRGMELDICPHCIADGAAAKKFDGSFHSILVTWEHEDGSIEVVNEAAAAAPKGVIEEIELRTPGYHSIQENGWLFHCSDGAVFEGSATPDDVRNSSQETIAHWENTNDASWSDWMPDHERKDMGVYKFRCRHCHLTMFHWDLG